MSKPVKELSLRGGHPQAATGSGEVPARLRRVPKWQKRFLSSLARLPDISRACKLARISRQTAYRWRSEDAAFAKAWADCIQQAVENLESYAFELAKTEPQILTFLLRAHKPELYRERQEHAHAVLGKIVLIPAKSPGDE
jgi:hypothetical protein